MSRNGAKWGIRLKLMTNPPSLKAYIGEFTHQLDARNRVTVPSSWRVSGVDAEGDYYFAWRHPEGCIAVFPPELRQELIERASAVRQSDLKGQAVLRKVFGKGHQFGCDKAGRILLPDSLIQHANIDRKVTLVGTGRSFQIWSAEKWQSEDDDDFNLLAAMEEMGI